jgi:hypothetical protein
LWQRRLCRRCHVEGFTPKNEVNTMPATTEAEAPLLKLETQLWKTRAEAKQKWLERVLAQPVRSPRERERRTMWIKRALEAVQRGQDEVKYQTALMDAYAEHLTVLEMRLIQAAEEKRGAPD